MTKMTNVSAIEFVLTNCEIPSEVAEKLTKMKEGFEKKSSAIRKPTATQTENVAFKAEVVEFLGTVERATITEMMKGIPSFGALSNQRASAIVRQLVLSGEVVRTEEKRKAFFSLAE